MRPFYLNSELKKATQLNFGGSHLCLEIRPTNVVKNDKKREKNNYSDASTDNSLLFLR